MKRLTHSRRASDQPKGMPTWAAYAIVLASLAVLGLAGWVEGGMK